MFNHCGINCLGADSVIFVENNVIQENTAKREGKCGLEEEVGAVGGLCESGEGGN